jgi:hypothetical protein
LKLVFYGPSLGGKTTALRWLYGKVEGLQKGEFTAIEDETNRTLFFDYVPMSAGGRVLFDVFTVAGQKRHRLHLTRETRTQRALRNSSCSLEMNWVVQFPLS